MNWERRQRGVPQATARQARADLLSRCGYALPANEQTGYFAQLIVVEDPQAFGFVNAQIGMLGAARLANPGNQNQQLDWADWQRRNGLLVHQFEFTGHAIEKAKETLMDCLDERQKRDFAAFGCFTVSVKNGPFEGRYRINTDRSFSVMQLETNDQYCVTAYEVPIYDQMLAVKLLLENEPEAFFRKANIHPGARTIDGIVETIRGHQLRQDEMTLHEAQQINRAIHDEAAAIMQMTDQIVQTTINIFRSYRPYTWRETLMACFGIERSS